MSVCNAVQTNGLYNGQTITVRGTPNVTAHETLLIDGACPQKYIFIKNTHRNVDLMLCNSERLSSLYGCPPNPASGVRFTVTGTYQQNPKQLYGVLEITKLVDVSSDATTPE